MTDPTQHVTEDDLILHFYGESPNAERVDQHLASCAHCRDAFDQLKQLFALVDTADGFSPTEPPGPAFEREVWARLQPQLMPRQSWFARMLWPGAGSGRRMRLVMAGGIASLVLVAFLAGRFSNEVLPVAPDATSVADGDVAGRILVVAVVDHLDRSQMVLLEVLNREVENAADMATEQSLARELVSANRLYRQTAVQAGDDATSGVLDELERVLLEIANTPQDATRDDLDALRARIAAGGLLFRVRVVHSEMREREQQPLLPGSSS